MSDLGEKFVVDAEGRKTAVLLDLETYRGLLASVEELDSIRAYDEAKRGEDDAIPFEQAVEEIERNRE